MASPHQIKKKKAPPRLPSPFSSKIVTFDKTDSYESTLRTVAMKCEMLLSVELRKWATEVETKLQGSHWNLTFDELGKLAVPKLSGGATDENPQKTDPNKGKLMRRSGFTAKKNSAIALMVEDYLPYLLKLIEAVRNLEAWVGLMAPPMEDGNNFGVNVQEAAVGELPNVQVLIQDYKEIYEYYFNRALIWKKIRDYPNVECVTQQLLDFDAQFYINLKSRFKAIGSNCLMAYHVMVSNIEKIKDPK